MPRDSVGGYSPTAGNPVVTGTTITAAWANSLIADLGSEIQGSLSREGKGGMLASLRQIDGSVGSPSVAWTNDTAVGLYRSASGEASIVAGGSAVAKWTVAGFFASLIQSLTTVSLRLLGRQVDGASAVGVISDTATTYSTDGAKIHSFRNNTTEKASVAYDGDFVRGGVGTPTAVFSTADQTSTSSTFTNVTGLAFSIVASGTYFVEGFFFITSPGTQIVAQFTGPASPTKVSGDGAYVNSAAWDLRRMNPGPTGFSSPFPLTTNGIATSHTPMTFQMLIVNGANAGTVQMQMRNLDNASTITMARGSMLRYTRLA